MAAVVSGSVLAINVNVSVGVGDWSIVVVVVGITVTAIPHIDVVSSGAIAAGFFCAAVAKGRVGA